MWPAFLRNRDMAFPVVRIRNEYSNSMANIFHNLGSQNHISKIALSRPRSNFSSATLFQPRLSPAAVLYHCHPLSTMIQAHDQPTSITISLPQKLCGGGQILPTTTPPPPPNQLIANVCTPSHSFTHFFVFCSIPSQTAPNSNGTTPRINALKWTCIFTKTS